MASKIPVAPKLTVPFESLKSGLSKGQPFLFTVGTGFDYVNGTAAPISNPLFDSQAIVGLPYSKLTLVKFRSLFIKSIIATGTSNPLQHYVSFLNAGSASFYDTLLPPPGWDVPTPTNIISPISNAYVITLLSDPGAPAFQDTMPLKFYQSGFSFNVKAFGNISVDVSETIKCYIDLCFMVDP